MCSKFCKQLCQLKRNKTSSLEDSSLLQYSYKTNRFYATKKFIIVFTKARNFFYTEPSESN
jgi:hypothetical protein